MLVDGEAAASVKNIQYFLEYIEPLGGRQHSQYHEGEQNSSDTGTCTEGR